MLSLALLAACNDDGGSQDEVGDSSTSDTGTSTDATSDESGTTASTTDASTTDDATTDTSTTDDATTDATTDVTTDVTTDATDTTTDTTSDTTDEGGDVCGDGMVSGAEVCDDGINDGAYGGCNPDCMALAPYCGDGQLDGPEACDDANADLSDGCLDSCVVPGSCLELLDYDGMLTDGVYMIAPDGYMGAPFSAYCDMSTDGGGWTLVMRFAPQNGQFHFYSTHWTSETVVDELNLDPTAASDGKFPAYNHLPADELRGCLRNPMDMTYGCKPYMLPAQQTALALFTTTQVGSDTNMKGLYFMETQPEMLEWLTIQGRTLAEASIPNVSYVRVGINIDDDISCYDARVRFGLVLNNEANISTLNDAAGFGAQSYFTAQCDLAPGVDSGWRTASGFAAGPNLYSTAGHIWVR